VDPIPDLLRLSALTSMMLLTIPPRLSTEMERWSADAVLIRHWPSCDVYVEAPPL